ncbi:MAG: AlkZ family DNA glycosylase [Bacteroidales bacterium]|nr:AlkZ family DNA glycosylase [Bacteroidales bacterium]
MNPISARLLNQQLICPQFSTPHDVVSWMGAMQAQDYRMMRWAVGMRTKRPSAKAFEADFNKGRIIRTHLFRSTWQLVAAEDYRWMIDLCSAKARSGIRGWIKMHGLTISEEEEFRFQDYLRQALRGKGCLGREAIEAIVKDSPFRAELPRLKYQMILAEVGGVICSGDLAEGERNYALSEEKIPLQSTLPREDALAELARRYFRSHGPATLEDFVWWSGLNISDCRKGMSAIQNELMEERWKGLAFHIHRDSRTRGFRSGCVHLLPSYDEYLIGYKSRQVALHPDHRYHAHDQKGIFWPIILQDGEVVGNWSAAGGKIRTDIFHPGISLNEGALEEAIARYQKFNNR